MAANRHKIANLGQRTLQGVTDRGVPLGMTWQVAEVKKPLASVGRMCDAGHVAVLIKDGGCVVPRERMEEMMGQLERVGQSTLRMKRENGVCNFNLWVPTPPKEILRGNKFQELQELAEEEGESDFQRQGVHLM